MPVVQDRVICCELHRQELSTVLLRLCASQGICGPWGSNMAKTSWFASHSRLKACEQDDAGRDLKVAPGLQTLKFPLASFSPSFCGRWHTALYSPHGTRLRDRWGSFAVGRGTEMYSMASSCNRRSKLSMLCWPKPGRLGMVGYGRH